MNNTSQLSPVDYFFLGLGLFTTALLGFISALTGTTIFSWLLFLFIAGICFIVIHQNNSIPENIGKLPKKDFINFIFTIYIASLIVFATKFIEFFFKDNNSLSQILFFLIIILVGSVLLLWIYRKIS